MHGYGFRIALPAQHHTLNCGFTGVTGHHMTLLISCEHVSILFKQVNEPIPTPPPHLKTGNSVAASVSCHMHWVSSEVRKGQGECRGGRGGIREVRGMPLPGWPSQQRTSQRQGEQPREPHNEHPPLPLRATACRVDSGCIERVNAMMTTANTTPSLTANASGGCFSVLDNGDNDDGQYHPIPCCKREWGGVLLLFWATTTTTATSTPSLTGNVSGGYTPVVLGNNDNDDSCFHPLPCSKREQRGSSLLGGYRHPPSFILLAG
jgi:hypothetical protein